MITIIAIILRILANPFANVFQKRLTGSGHNALTVNFMSYLLLSVACLTISPGTDWPALSVGFWLYALLGGIFGSVGNAFLVLALHRGDLSILGPVNSYKSIVGMVTGIVLLGELPSLMGFAGVVVIVFGSYFIFETIKEGFSWRLLKNCEIQFRLTAMVLTAIEAVFIKKVILFSDTSKAFVVWCWFGALFAFLLQIVMRVNLRREVLITHKRDSLAFVAMTACIGITQYATTYTFSHIDVGYGLALFQLSTIVSVVMGCRLFHEQNIKKKLLGSVIMVAGAVMVIFSS